MITFYLNGKEKEYDGDPSISLLEYLREIEGIVSVKDGCSGQGACGACLTEVDGKPALSCRTPMSKVDQTRIVTIEGFDPQVREILGRAFVEKGAVQCGFCIPGIISRTKHLLETNDTPSRAEIVKALGPHICRCTGYIKIVDAILQAARYLRKEIALEETTSKAFAGSNTRKYNAFDRAIGKSPFVADMKLDGMLYGALRFSDHARAKVLKIDTAEAEKVPGVIRVFTYRDIPGDRINGHLIHDWPLMVAENETTRMIGDVLAGVVAKSEAIARKAAKLVSIQYEKLKPLTDVLQAETSSIQVHAKGNLLSRSGFKRGKAIEGVLAESDFVVTATYQTQRVEHAFMETEAALCQPLPGDQIRIYVQSQGIYEDRRLLARILNLPEEKVEVVLVPAGGGFGGKEDLTVQGHAALFAFLLKKPVRVRLNRPESLRMHPKRHPMIMKYSLGCSSAGRLTGLKAEIIGDTGAYASLGPAVLNRAASHAAGGYLVPNVDITAKTLYTNNLPCGAMRGFGVNQVTFAMESAVDELCEKGGFDRWQFRYDNALSDGSETTTGQILESGTGLRECLLAVKDDFQTAEYAGLAIGIKNIGFGNGLIDESETVIEIKSASDIVLHHGWTEMGQGVDTVAIQMLCQEIDGITPETVSIQCSTASEAIGGTTTASRGTFLLGKSIIEACRSLKADLVNHRLEDLTGRTYRGKWACDWTDPPGTATDHPVTHVAYGYAAQVVILDKKGSVARVIAAHDVGKAINPLMIEGQIEGSVVMGLGYAFSEKLELHEGQLKTDRFSKLGLYRVKQVPDIKVIILEIPDPIGPYGVKGIGEIGLIPTAAAAANAVARFDRKRPYRLPIKREKP